MAAREALRRQVADFIEAEVARLDAGDLAGWVDLCTDDAEYWMPVRRDQTDPLVLVPFADTPVDTDAVMRLESGFRADNGRIATTFARPQPNFLPFLP